MSTAVVEPVKVEPDAVRTWDAESAGTGGAAGRVTLHRAARSEWVKLRTLRSSWLILLAAAVSMIAIGAVIGYNTGKSFVGLAAEDSAPSGGLQGAKLAMLLVGVLGALLVTGEYGTGMSRSTMAAVPRRVPVLLAKSGVLTVVTLVTMVAASLATYAAAQAFLSSYGHGTSLTAPGVLRVVLGTGLYLTLVALLGSAIGWLVRSTAGAISTYAGLLLVLPLIVGLLPGSISTSFGRYLPSSAGDAFTSSVHKPDTLGPWSGLAVLVAWVLVALVAAAVSLRRRDA